jgi:hypothetical protein
MPATREPDVTIAEDAVGELAAILATGFLCPKCRRGYVPARQTSAVSWTTAAR